MLHLGDVDNLLVSVCTGVSNFLWLPVMGALSGRVGRRPMLVGGTILVLVTAYPALLWLTTAASFLRLLCVELWLSFLYASYNGATVVYLTELIPAGVKASGFSLAQSIAAAVFGGFTPAICTLPDPTNGQSGFARTVAVVYGLNRSSSDFHEPPAAGRANGGRDYSTTPDRLSARTVHRSRPAKFVRPEVRSFAGEIVVLFRQAHSRIRRFAAP